MLNSIDTFELMLILSKVTINNVPFIKYIEGDIDYKNNVIYLNDLIPNHTYLKIGEPSLTSHTMYLKRVTKGSDTISIAPITLREWNSLIVIEKVFAKIAAYIERRRQYDTGRQTESDLLREAERSIAKGTGQEGRV